MGDTSLDDFVGEDEESGGDDSGGADAGDAADGPDDAGGNDVADSSTDVDGPEAAEPATSTYDWTPAGAECADCGATVERRWRDGDLLVCGDCKDW